MHSAVFDTGVQSALVTRGIGSFLVPADAAAEARLNESFHEIAGSEGVAGKVLEIGRAHV